MNPTDILVLFDCDGVLVDSEPLGVRVFVEMLNRHDIPITFEEGMKKLTGRNFRHILNDLEFELGRKFPDYFEAEYRERTTEVYKNELKAIEGIHGALVELPYPKCVASSGPHEKLRLNLSKVGLFDLFEGRIFSAVDVERGKPFPDLFLHAAKSMGYEPSRCIVVEDAVPGVKAGVAAGMKVLGFADRTTEDELQRAGAVRTFRQMSKLPELLGQLKLKM